MQDVYDIIRHFNLYGDFIDSQPYGAGHINDIFLVRFNQAGQNVSYILRKLNSHVFNDPGLIVDNAVAITEHIRNKLTAQRITDVSRKVLTLIKTDNDQYSFIDSDGKYWCLNMFITNAFTVDSVSNPKQAFEAARTFGNFQNYLSDFAIEKCHTTIPDFHNLSKRLDHYDKILKGTFRKRGERAAGSIKNAEKFRPIETAFLEIERNQIPIRITHNDTKINNVMFDEKTNEGLCVLDLDTVMPGTVLNDFGDMVRSFVNPLQEDDPDIHNVIIKLDIFESIVKGYLGILKNTLTEIEISSLVTGSKIIIYEQAIRFLTDFLEGDVYYKTDYENHNLVRAENQFALLESVEQFSDKMQMIVDKYSV